MREFKETETSEECMAYAKMMSELVLDQSLFAVSS